MRLTIIRDDNLVIIDGRSAKVDLSGMIANYHAVQWHGDHGEVETVRGDNIQLKDLATFDAFIKKAQAVFKAEDDLAVFKADIERSIDTVRARALHRVDQAASQARQRFVTVLPGQDMIYMQKLVEATAIAADQTPLPGSYPLLAAEIGVTGETLPHVAEAVLARAEAWKVAAGQIERTRLTAKHAIEAARDVTAIELTLAGLFAEQAASEAVSR